MGMGKAIITFLGLQDVVIEDVKLYKKDLKAIIVVRQDPDKTKCIECGSDLLSRHSWEYRELKAPPMGIFQKILVKLYYQRGACEKCMAIKTAKIPFVHSRFRGMTCGFIEVAGATYGGDHMRSCCSTIRV